MRIYDIIAKKRDGFPLSQEEIRFFVERYTQGEIPDYQASALLMAVSLTTIPCCRWGLTVSTNWEVWTCLPA